MTYEEALAFWYRRVNYEVRAPQPSDLKLDRMRGLLRHLGDPHLRIRAVHVAGSKGKGSTAAMLAAVLQRAGYRTGLFTSPHLSRVEGRIQVDGHVITANELTSLMAEIRDAVTADEARHPDEEAPTPTLWPAAEASVVVSKPLLWVAVTETSLVAAIDEPVPT